jgi:hypothetical protein
MTRHEEFIEFLQEFKRRLMDQGYPVMSPNQAASPPNEKTTPTYARTGTDPTESHPL